MVLIPASVVRVTFGGDLPGGEVWVSGFHMDWGSTPPTTEAGMNTLAQTIAGILTGSGGALTYAAGHFWQPGATCRFVACYGYDGSGSGASVVGRYELPSALNGTSSHYLPNQCSQVVSLRTPYSGRNARGRMYIPCTGMPCDPGGQADNVISQNHCNAWASSFDDINGIGSGQVVVFSPATLARYGVARLVVDSKVDIQRRRANREAPSYTYQATVTG